MVSRNKHQKRLHCAAHFTTAFWILLLLACDVNGRDMSSTSAASANAYASRLGQDAGGIQTWKQLVSYMNQHRARHGAPPLKWDTKLYRSAESWAKNCQFKHSGNGLGENLGWNYENWKQVVDAWYNEEKLYNYKSPGWDPKIGHFTQVVWKGSKAVACAYACQIYVCQYWPPGNVIGSFDKNVGKKKW